MKTYKKYFIKNNMNLKYNWPIIFFVDRKFISVKFITYSHKVNTDIEDKNKPSAPFLEY